MRPFRFGCSVRADRNLSFTVRPVSFEGKFEISEFIGPDGKHLAIYRMVGEAVK
jgi:hypothetical protein